MKNPILERLAAKSDFSNIQIKPIDLSEQQDEMLDFLTNQYYTKDRYSSRSILTSVLKERGKQPPTQEEEFKNTTKECTKVDITFVSSPLMPLSARKRLLYQEAQGICTVLQIDEIIV